VLADEKGQPGESRLFGQRDFERSPEQSWYVKRGIHPQNFFSPSAWTPARVRRTTACIAPYPVTAGVM
jgi:hypothetical protein